MKTESEVRAGASIKGNMIDLGTGEVIAIYERNGVCWVAEFHGDHAELEYAGSWFRFCAGRLRAFRIARNSPTPLTPEMLERIERLHLASEAQQEKMLALPRAVAAAAQRCLLGVMSRLRGGASRMGRTPG